MLRVGRSLRNPPESLIWRGKPGRGASDAVPLPLRMDHGGKPLAGQTRLQRIGHLRMSPVTVTYVAYYNAKQAPTGLGDPPEGSPIEPRPSPAATVVGLPPLEDLYHGYVCADGAQGALALTPRPLRIGG
jgi:hypothetical protein